MQVRAPSRLYVRYIPGIINMKKKLFFQFTENIPDGGKVNSKFTSKTLLDRRCTFTNKLISITKAHHKVYALFRFLPRK